MVARRPRARGGPSLGLLAFLLVAIAVGLAATFLAATPPPSAPSNPSEVLIGPIGLSTVGWLLLAIISLPFFVMVYRRLTMPRQPSNAPLYVTLLIIALLFLAFIFIARSLSYGAPPGNTTQTPGAGPPPSSNSTKVTTNGSNGTGEMLLPGIPVWAGYLLLIGLPIVGIVVLLLRRPTEAEEETAPETAAVRRSLAQALTDLSRPEADPRAVIVALYAQLLARVGPRLDQLDSATPREIARECERRFGIRPVHAEGLTRLFEIARYSSHPLSRAQVEEARSALSGALADLGSGGSR